MPGTRHFGSCGHAGLLARCVWRVAGLGGERRPMRRTAALSQGELAPTPESSAGSMAGFLRKRLSPADVEANVALDGRLGNAVPVVDEKLVPHVSGLIGDIRPLVWVGRGGLEFEVAVGDSAQLSSVDEVADQSGPFRSVGSLGVEVCLESVGGVTPYCATRRRRRHGAQEFDLPRLRVVDGFEDAFGPRLFEAVGDDTKVDDEVAAFGCGGIEGRPAFLLMGVEGFESLPSVGFGLVGPLDPVVGLLEAVGGGADGTGVASWPSLP